MPRNKVVNRRNLDALKVRSIPLSDDATAILKSRAAALSVSQGSLADMLLREMARWPDQLVLDMMRTHGLLTEAEYGLALDLNDKSKKLKDAGDEPGVQNPGRQAGE